MSPRSLPPDVLRLTELLDARGWSRPDLARESGLSLTSIDNALNGKAMDKSTLAALANALGASIEDIVLRESESPISHRPELAKHILSFDAFIEDRTRDFVGREFVFDSIDQFLEDPTVPCGYFLGIPKTDQFVPHPYNLFSDK